VRFIIAEELAVLPIGLIYNIVLPTMILANTVFIGISSRPVDEDSPMYKLISKTYPETGLPVIVSRIFTTICDVCRRQGKRDCNHTVENHWSSKEQSRKIELLMSDRREDYEREMRNEEAVDKLVSAAFRRTDIEAMNQSDHDYTGDEPQSLVFMAVDPHAGGKSSMTACVSIITPIIYDSRLNQRRTDLVVRLLLLLRRPFRLGLGQYPWCRRQVLSQRRGVWVAPYAQ
jgi:hypothetical protein